MSEQSSLSTLPKYRADTYTIDLATALEAILMGRQSASKINYLPWESQGK